MVGCRIKLACALIEGTAELAWVLVGVVAWWTAIWITMTETSVGMGARSHRLAPLGCWGLLHRLVGVINTARRIIKTLTISESSIVLLLGVLRRITTQRTSLLLLSCSVKFINHNLHLICSFLAILLNLFDKNFNPFLDYLVKLLTLCNFFYRLIETLERQYNIVKVSIDCRILLLVLNNFVESSAILQDYVFL